MIKYRQALRAMFVLSRDPFDFSGLNAMVDAVSQSWFVQTWYRRLIEGTPRPELERLRVLTKRPMDFDWLCGLPENTLGRHYTKFYLDNGLTFYGHEKDLPDLFETFEKDWVTHRFYKIHDILHTIGGFGTDVASELGLQMFDAVNLREPYGIGALASSPYMVLRYGQPVKTVKEILRGYRIGRRAPNLFFVPFEEMWELDIDELRERFGLVDRA